MSLTRVFFSIWLILTISVLNKIKWRKDFNYFFERWDSWGEKWVFEWILWEVIKKFDLPGSSSSCDSRFNVIEDTFKNIDDLLLPFFSFSFFYLEHFLQFTYLFRELLKDSFLYFFPKFRVFLNILVELGNFLLEDFVKVFLSLSFQLLFLFYLFSNLLSLFVECTE